jgi:Arc/MetJ family transcription regulator
VTKRLVDVDDDLVVGARQVLGTATLKATVNMALREVVDRAVRLEHLERLRTMDGLDLDDPVVMGGAWREGRS